MYSKGANLLHTLRQIAKDDQVWRKILRGLNKEFYHQTVTTEQIENYISKRSKIDLSAFFNQYLRDIRIPTLEYKYIDSKLVFRWVEIVNGFDMPIKTTINNQEKWIYPSQEWKEFEVTENVENFKIDENFYVKSIRFD